MVSLMSKETVVLGIQEYQITKITYELSGPPTPAACVDLTVVM